MRLQTRYCSKLLFSFTLLSLILTMIALRPETSAVAQAQSNWKEHALSTIIALESTDASLKHNLAGNPTSAKQAPMIICPPNVTAVGNQTCPAATGAVVTFPAPTVVAASPAVTTCSPASGSTFPVGCTPVVCIAMDTLGNSAACSFSVCVFSGCLQDDSNSGNVVLFDTATGQYRFCCDGVSVAEGTGTVYKQGCMYTIQHNTSDRRVLIKVDFAVKRGTASIQNPAGTLKCTIADKNITDNTCNCMASIPVGASPLALIVLASLVMSWALFVSYRRRRFRRIDGGTR